LPEAKNNRERPVMSGPGGGPGFGRGPGFGGGHGRGMVYGPKAQIKDAKGTLRRLWGYLRRRSRLLAAVLLMTLLAAAANTAGPLLIGRAIDNYIVPGDLFGLLRMALVMLSVYAAGALATLLQNYLMVDVAQNTVQELRNDLFAKLQTLPLRFFDSRTHGELMSRVTNDIDNVNNTLSTSVTQLFASFITVVGTLVMMTVLSPLLTLISVSIIPVMFFATGKIAKRTGEYFLEQQRQLGRLNGFIEETISGQRVVKVFTQEEKVIDTFASANARLRDIGTRAQIFAGIIMPFMGVLNNLSFAIIAGVGGWMVVRGMLTIGVIASFINYSRQFARPLNEIANQFNMIQSAIAGAERVFQIMDEEPEAPDRPGAPDLAAVAGKVEFAGVTFGYQPQVPVLQDISFTVEPGQTVALVGPTGAGKTTLVNLLTRFYDVDAGTIRIDDRDIRSVRRDSLRASLGIVLQDTHLFSETVRENIRYGRLTATDAEVEAAARTAYADQFIRRLPQGYDTVLTEDGGNLSQGQRQLLAIARAILADPAILILDEATSSVDTRTEVYIQEAMLRLMQGRSSLVIAHRLSTIRGADLILVLSGGRIVERGTHEQLLAAKGFYYDLYTSQFRRAAS